MDQGEEKPKHPLTGEPYDEEAERAKLIPLDEISTTSKELRQSFQKYVNEHLIPDIAYRDFDQRSDPTKLFFAREVRPSSEGPNTRRVYFKKDSNGNFREAYDLQFDKSPRGIGEVTRFYVHLVGEEFNAPYEELDSFIINCDLSLARAETMDIQSKINSRVLRLKYWEGGKIDTLEFNSDQRLHFNDDVDLTSDIFEEVKEKKQKKIIESRDAKFEITYEEESDLIEIRRIFGAKQTDFISFPMQIDFQEVQKKILTGQLVDKPVKTGTDEDVQWKSVTVNALGINWQRS